MLTLIYLDQNGNHYLVNGCGMSPIDSSLVRFLVQQGATIEDVVC